MVRPLSSTVAVVRTDPELEVHSINDDKHSLNNVTSSTLVKPSNRTPICSNRSGTTEANNAPVEILENKDDIKHRLNDFGYDITDSDDLGDDSKGSKIDLGYHFTWSEDDEPTYLEQQGFGINVYESIRAISKEASKKIDAVLAVDHVDQLQEEMKKLREEIKLRKAEFSELKCFVQMKDHQIGTLELERDLYKADTTKLANDLEACLLKLRRIGGVLSPFSHVSASCSSSEEIDAREVPIVTVPSKTIETIGITPSSSDQSTSKSQTHIANSPISQAIHRDPLKNTLYLPYSTDSKNDALQPEPSSTVVSLLSRQGATAPLLKDPSGGRVQMPVCSDSTNEASQTVPTVATGTTAINTEVKLSPHRSNASSLTDSPIESNAKETSRISSDIFSNKDKLTNEAAFVTPPRYSTFAPVVEKPKRDAFPIRYILTGDQQNVNMSTCTHEADENPGKCRTRKRFSFGFCNGTSNRRNRKSVQQQLPPKPTQTPQLDIPSDGNIGILPMPPNHIIDSEQNMNHVNLHQMPRPRGILQGQILEMNQRLHTSIRTSEDLRRNIAMLHRHYEQQLNEQNDVTKQWMDNRIGNVDRHDAMAVDGMKYRKKVEPEATRERIQTTSRNVTFNV